MVNTYICTTPYHLLISIIKVLLNKEEGKHDLILDQLTNFSSETLENVNYSNLFKSVILSSAQFNYKAKVDFFLHKLGFVPNRLFSESPLSKEYFIDKNIFIFHDLHYFGQLLNSFKIPYNLIEDGCNVFKMNIPCNRNIPFWRIFCKIRGLYPVGLSPLIKTIEVNSAENLLIKKNNVIECPRGTMFKALSEEQKKKVCEIFGLKQKDWIIKSNSTLLLTQPLCEDGIMSHDAKIALFKYLIQKYGSSNLYIKSHPRDTDDYDKIFPNAVVFRNNKIPLELINCTCEFDKVITAFSTAIYSEMNAKEKIFFGLKESLAFAKRFKSN